MAPALRRARLIPVLIIAAGCVAPASATHSTLNDYTTHLTNLHTLLAECLAQPVACDPAKAGADDEFNLPEQDAGRKTIQFEVRYDWLRETLKAAHDPAMKDRQREVNAALVRLDEELQNAKNAASSPNSTSDNVAHARTRVNAILQRPEFVTVSNQSIWSRLIAHIFFWLDDFFGGVAKFGKRSPWIGPTLEWGSLGFALTGLVLWAMRVLQRQRLRVRIETARQLEPWEEASRNWRVQAEEQAQRHEWREAVHCLYWASIVMLEGRRFWTPNRSRTPREYLRLLETGSSRWTLLRQQTLGFEHIWYGLRPAELLDYESALHLHEQLRTA